MSTLEGGKCLLSCLCFCTGLSMAAAQLPLHPLFQFAEVHFMHLLREFSAPVNQAAPGDVQFPADVPMTQALGDEVKVPGPQVGEVHPFEGSVRQWVECFFAACADKLWTFFI